MTTRKPRKIAVVKIPRRIGPKRSAAILDALDKFTATVPGACQPEVRFTPGSDTCVLVAWPVPKGKVSP